MRLVQWIYSAGLLAKAAQPSAFHLWVGLASRQGLLARAGTAEQMRRGRMREHTHISSCQPQRRRRQRPTTAPVPARPRASPQRCSPRNTPQGNVSQHLGMPAARRELGERARLAGRGCCSSGRGSLTGTPRARGGRCQELGFRWPSPQLRHASGSSGGTQIAPAAVSVSIPTPHPCIDKMSDRQRRPTSRRLSRATMQHTGDLCWSSRKCCRTGLTCTAG